MGLIKFIIRHTVQELEASVFIIGIVMPLMLYGLMQQHDHIAWIDDINVIDPCNMIVQA